LSRLPARVTRFATAVWRRFDEDHSLELSASLAFATLLAIVPLFTIGLTVFAAMPAFQDLVRNVNELAARAVLPPVIAKPILQAVDHFVEQAGSLRKWSLVLFALTGLTLVANVERAFNHLWRVRRSRPWLGRAVMYLLVLTLGPIALAASLSVTTFLVGASLGTVPLPFDLADRALQFVPFLVMAGMFTLLYMVLPNRRVRFVHALAGGLCAALLFDLAKSGFALYLRSFTTYATVYGAFALIPIFLLWLYVSWAITMLGAVVAALAPEWASLGRPAPASHGGTLREALSVLHVLMDARGRRPPSTTAIAVQSGVPVARADVLLEDLQRAGWVRTSGRDRWALACDPAAVTIADVRRHLVPGLDEGALAAAGALDQTLARAARAADAILAEPLTLLDETQAVTGRRARDT
jgi:membrane protein